MRRLIVEEPVSRAALWSPRVGWFAVFVTLMALALVRFGRVEFTVGVVPLGAGLALAAAAACLALLAFWRIWSEGRRGLKSALGGLVLAGLILGYPAWFAFRALTLPTLNDITTDVDNPPTFSRSQAALQARGGWIPPEVPVERRREQRAAYPQIAPLSLDLSPEEAFELARKAATNRGWHVIEAAKPGGRLGLGRIEAIDRTFLLRIPDDVTVRIRPRADGARIDVRSASRIGRHDLGQNASRIRRYLEEVSNLAIASK
jgi:uncharacterized protein (DUF1499 family)